MPSGRKSSPNRGHPGKAPQAVPQTITIQLYFRRTPNAQPEFLTNVVIPKDIPLRNSALGPNGYVQPPNRVYNTAGGPALDINKTSTELFHGANNVRLLIQEPPHNALQGQQQIVTRASMPRELTDDGPVLLRRITPPTYGKPLQHYHGPIPHDPALQHCGPDLDSHSCRVPIRRISPLAMRRQMRRSGSPPRIPFQVTVMRPSRKRSSPPKKKKTSKSPPRRRSSPKTVRVRPSSASRKAGQAAIRRSKKN